MQLTADSATIRLVNTSLFVDRGLVVQAGVFGELFREGAINAWIFARNIGYLIISTIDMSSSSSESRRYYGVRQ